jgi:hypothetical protein
VVRRLVIFVMVFAPVTAAVLGVMSMGVALFGSPTHPTVPASVSVPSQVRVVQSQSRLQEDDPGWDCRTMGNRQCGPVSDEQAYQYCMAYYHAEAHCKQDVFGP